MERAFVVSARAPGAELRIEALRCRLSDAPTRPSRSVLRRVVRLAGPALFDDVAEDPELRDQRSVRALDLRSVCGTTIPAVDPDGRRCVALIADSRVPAGARLRSATASGLPALMTGFASLAALVLGREASARADPPAGETAEPGLVGRSAAFTRMLRWVRRIAPYDLAVLVRGESGSGKEGVVRALHRHSRRRDGPLVALNCAALPETLLESELFGAVRGAYTGSERDRPGLMRRADGGTLLLDEIGDMSLAMQAKLLRVLQSGRVRPVGGDREIEVDVRVVAATHRDLLERVSRGAFRNDLYHRIAVVVVRVPALRERPDDLAPLAAHLIARVARETGLASATVTASALERLRAHDWPGNVRELRAVLTRALLRGSDGRIRAADLDLSASATAPPVAGEGSLERAMIERALGDCDHNLADAARRIGWSRQKLYRRMTALGVARRPARR